MTTLVAFATATEQIQIGTSMMLAPLHNPVESPRMRLR
jgi:alkanesulfonate monooxygenase SsuD/methylene tetrahydromethanopterin reductase-like flavin-dependent oxidoreductase (luciferase family)